MSLELDALVYQWVLSEEEQKSPLVFSSLDEHTDTDKIKSLLEVHAQMVQDLDSLCNEASSLVEALSSELCGRLGSGFLEEAQDDVVTALTEHESVASAFDDVERMQSRLTVFENDLAKALV